MTFVWIGLGVVIGLAIGFAVLCYALGGVDPAGWK